MQGMKGAGPEGFLEEVNQIYAEREEEFQKREHAYQEKREGLQRLLREVADGRVSLEEKQRDLDAREGRLQAFEKQLKEREGAIAAEEARLAKASEEVAAHEKELVLKNSLELEQARNERLKLKRLKEDYAFKVNSLDAGLQDALAGPAQGVDLEKYMLRSEHEEQAGIQAKEAERLKEEIKSLQEERVVLLKHNLELREEVKQANTQEKENMAPAAPFGRHGGAQAGMEAGPAGGGITEEEITAEVLKNYLDKNGLGYEGVSVRHSDMGDQLHAERGGLKYRFLFGKPGSFDILAQRKESGALKKRLAQMNQEHPEIKFQYQDGEVAATGYFPDGIKAYDLMARVNKVSECFR